MTSEPWEWPDERWAADVNRVRAGRRLSAEWPGGARVAVALSFDSDHETGALRDGHVSPGVLAQGEYGARRGTPRILALLSQRSVPATFFIPAVSALLHEEEVRACVDAGHEIGAHGWIHERTTLLSEPVERDLLLRSLDALERLAGARPVGMRTPSWDFSSSTLALAVEAGLIYDSSLMADDDCYEILSDGRPTGLIEVPVDWIRDDAVYFKTDRYAAHRPYTPPRSVLGIWIDEFDRALAERGVFQLTMHPHIIGHRSRIGVLEALLDHICQRSDVWWATHKQIAAHVAAANGGMTA